MHGFVYKEYDYNIYDIADWLWVLDECLPTLERIDDRCQEWTNYFGLISINLSSL
jgi:hypothetical protein